MVLIFATFGLGISAWLCQVSSSVGIIVSLLVLYSVCCTVYLSSRLFDRNRLIYVQVLCDC